MTSTDDDAMTTWELGLDPEVLVSLRTLRARPPFAQTDIVATRATTRDEARALPREPDVARTYDDVVPGRDGAPAVPVRVYVPSVDARPGVVVHLHGGGYVFGDLDSTDNYTRALAVGTGRVVVSVDYRLAPEHRYPAGLDDCERALDWVLAGGVEGVYGVDAEQVSLHGASAGAGLAAALCLRRRDQGRPLPTSLVLVVPCIDPALDEPSCREFADTTALSRNNLRWMWAQYLGPDGDFEDAADGYAAPARAARLAGLPRTLVATAEFDPLRDEGEAFARRLAAAGVEVHAVRYPNTIHGFLVFPRIEQAQALMRDTAAFVAGDELRG